MEHQALGCVLKSDMPPRRPYTMQSKGMRSAPASTSWCRQRCSVRPAPCSSGSLSLRPSRFRPHGAASTTHSTQQVSSSTGAHDGHIARLCACGNPSARQSLRRPPPPLILNICAVLAARGARERGAALTMRLFSFAERWSTSLTAIHFGRPFAWRSRPPISRQNIITAAQIYFRLATEMNTVSHPPFL